MRNYELVFIVSPEVTAETLPTTVEKVSQMVSARGGTVTEVKPWGKRRLAYPIKRFREGNYFLAQLQMDPQKTSDLESSLRISEEILRHLLVKLGDTEQ